jgi:C4-dicarboxylate transporter DctQ subunit
MLRLYDWLIVGLAALGAVSLVFITGAIAVDVVLRNIGFAPMRWTSTVVEYVLLFVTMAASPWLIRLNGHVSISSFTGLLPPRGRHVLGIAVILLSMAVLSLLSWRSAELAYRMMLSGATDIRSINMPGWVLYAMLAAGFALMTLEYLRLLLRGETHSGMSGGGH